MWGMVKRFASTLLLCAAVLLVIPGSANAYPFGGRTGFVIPCVFNLSVLAVIGAPDPGFYIWTPFTRTYSNGPPSHSGQWLLGLTSIPYICVVFPVGPIIIPGMAISMMGSS